MKPSVNPEPALCRVCWSHTPALSLCRTGTQPCSCRICSVRRDSAPEISFSRSLCRRALPFHRQHPGAAWHWQHIQALSWITALAETENQSLHFWLLVGQNSSQLPPKAVMHLLSFASSILIHRLNNHQFVKVNMLAYNIKRRKKKEAFYIKISLKSCCLWSFTPLQQLRRRLSNYH